MTSAATSVVPAVAGLDLNDLARNLTPITLGGQTWQIADDFDARLGLEMMLVASFGRLTRIQDAIKRLGDDPAIETIEAATRAAIDAYEAQVNRAMAMLFQHSGYPDMTEEHVASTFALGQREHILGHFFLPATPPSPQPSGAGTTTPSDPTATATGS